MTITRNLSSDCKKCDSNNWGYWSSSTTGKKSRYCRTCRQGRAKMYNQRLKNAEGSHTEKDWLEKFSQYDKCPHCSRLWVDIPPRPDKRYKRVWTKDHKIQLTQGGTNDINNLQPLCYSCNSGKRENCT